MMRKKLSLVLVYLPSITLLVLLQACASAPSQPQTNSRPVFDLNSKIPTVVSESSPQEIEAFSALPSSPYKISSADVLRIRSDSGEFQDDEVRVSPEGNINVSKVGWVAVAGLQIPEAEKLLSEAANQIYSNGSCRLILVSSPNRKVSILGAVKAPGIQSMEGDLTVVDAVARAGGLDQGANEKRAPTERKILCRIIREGSSGVWIDLRRVLFGNDLDLNLKLRSGDVLYVIRQ